MSIVKYKLGSQTTVLSTGLNSLTNNSIAISSAFNNKQGGGGGDGYIWADLELVVQYGSAPTANTGCAVWFLISQDDTNYEDGDGTPTTPARIPDVVIPLRAVTSAQRINQRVMLPQGNIKFLLKNDGTGQTMAASNNTLKVRPVTPENV